MIILAVLWSALVIIAVFSVLILVHEAGHFFVSRKVGVRVERFALGFGKKLFGVKKGHTEYVINLIPFGGYVKLAGENPDERKGEPDELYSKPVGKRFWILASGSLSNYVFAFLILVCLYFFGVPTLRSDVGAVLKDSPSEKAGIKAGDTIVSIDGKTVKYWDDVLKIVRADTDAKPLAVTIERDGQRQAMNITPKLMTGENVFKQKTKFVGIGVAPGEKVEIVKSDPFKAFELAGKHVWFFTVTTYKGIWFMITGAMPVKENVGGPIRIIEVLNNSIKYGPLSVMNIMATISLALAIFNLLPFPILDGGHILFLLVEKIRRKPLSLKAQENVAQVAFFLLIAFVLYVSYFDTVRVVSHLKK